MDRVDQVGIVAQDSSDARLADLFQLFQRERRRLVAVLVPEPVAGPHVAELRGDDASERRTEETARQGALGNAAGPQVDVVRRPAIDSLHLIEEKEINRGDWCYLARVFVFQLSRKI